MQHCVQIRWQEIVVKYGWLKIHPKIPTVIEGNHVSPLFDQPSSIRSSNNTCISNQMPLSIFLKIWKPKVPNCFLMNCYISLLHRTSFRNLHFKQWCYRAKRPIPFEPEEFDGNMNKHRKNSERCPGHSLTVSH